MPISPELVTAMIAVLGAFAYLLKKIADRKPKERDQALFLMLEVLNRNSETLAEILGLLHGLHGITIPGHPPKPHGEPRSKKS